MANIKGAIIMKKLSMQLFAAAVAVLMLFSFTACKGRSNNPDPIDVSNSSKPQRTATPTVDPETISKITLTVDARNAYNDPNLPAEVKAQLFGSGLMMNGAEITMPVGTPLSNAFRVLELSGIPVVVENGAVTSVKGVANGSCGENSRWMLFINGTENTSNVDELTVNSGDDIRFIYTVNGGEDVNPDQNGTDSPETTPVSTSNGSSGGDTARATPLPTADPNVTADPNSKTHN